MQLHKLHQIKHDNRLSHLEPYHPTLLDGVHIGRIAIEGRFVFLLEFVFRCKHSGGDWLHSRNLLPTLLVD